MTPTPQTQPTPGVVQNAKRNWKTTITGILALAISGWGVYTNPTSAADPQVLTAILAGIGLIVAKDGDKTGAAQ